MTVTIVSKLILMRLRCKLLTTLTIAIITAHMISVTMTYRLIFGPNGLKASEMFVVLYGCYEFSNVNGTVVTTVTGSSGILP